jgi:hypothetical protein
LQMDIGQEFHTPAECEQYMRLVLKARSRLEIETGKVTLSRLRRNRGAGMHLDDMRAAR